MNSPRGIILIQSDQHRYDCMAHTGHPLVKTPNLDRLAKEGLSFNNAFCTSPMCVPTRTSQLCGQWTQQHGTLANFDCESPKFLSREKIVFPYSLKQKNISLDFVGRWHVHPDLLPTDFGFDSFVSYRDYHNYRKKIGVEPYPIENGFFGNIDPYISPEQSRPHWLTDLFIEKLRNRVNNNKPFYINLDLHEPHLPNIVPEPYNSMYPPEKIKPWGNFSDELENKPFIQKQQLRTWEVENWTWNDWAPIIGRYLGDISLLDKQIGRIFDELDSLGVADDILIIYTADHGDMCGSHRMVDKHFVMYDEVVHVPLIMRWPKVIKPNSVHSGFVSNAIDLAATFCDVMNAEIPKSFSGISLKPVIFGENYPARNDIFCCYNGNQFGQYSQRMVRNNKWKYVWNATSIDELYDLENDKFELNNLAQNLNYKKILAEMRLRLWEWMKQTDDRLQNFWIENQLLKGNKI